MSMQDALAFVKKMQEDEAFRKQIAEASTADRPGLVKAAGFDFTKQELKTLQDAAAGKLPDTALDGAAGGLSGSQWGEIAEDGLEITGEVLADIV